MLDALRGLEARLVVAKPTGEVIGEADVTYDLLIAEEEYFKILGCGGYGPMKPHTPWLLLQAKYCEDDCRMVLSVLRPAPGMKGRKQELVGKDIYCRMVEAWDYVGWTLLALGAGSGSLGLLLMRKLWRSRHASAPSPEPLIKAD